MARYYNVLPWLYIPTVLLWGLLWIPFGIGYYELPWHDSVFRWFIQLWAWALVGGGIFLVLYWARHERRWWPSAVGLVLSLLTLAIMYDWIARYVSML